MKPPRLSWPVALLYRQLAHRRRPAAARRARVRCRRRVRPVDAARSRAAHRRAQPLFGTNANRRRKATTARPRQPDRNRQGPRRDRNDLGTLAGARTRPRARGARRGPVRRGARNAARASSSPRRTWVAGSFSTTGSRTRAPLSIVYRPPRQAAIEPLLLKVRGDLPVEQVRAVRRRRARVVPPARRRRRGRHPAGPAARSRAKASWRRSSACRR